MPLSNSTSHHKCRTKNKNYGLPPFPRLVNPFNPRFLPDVVAWLFGLYGSAVGRWPYVFLVLGLVIGFTFSIGTKEMFANDIMNPDINDLMKLFLEESSRYISDSKVLNEWVAQKEEMYKRYTNEKADSSFVRSRRQAPRSDKSNNRLCTGSRARQRFQSVMIVAKNDSLISKEALDEVFEHAIYMRNLLRCDFDDVTNQIWNRYYCCSSIDIISIRQQLFSNDQIIDMSDGEIMAFFYKRLRYPIDTRIPEAYRTTFSSSLGGVTVEDINNRYNSRVTGIKAMMSVYFLPETAESSELEDMMNRELWKVRKRYKHIDVQWTSFQQSVLEFAATLANKEMPKIGVTFICVFVWCSVATLHTDPVDSKPLLGFAAIFATGLSSTAGFGVQLYLGKKFESFLIAVPLMALALGLDDMFILLNAWRNTSEDLPREERSKRMMIEGGTSIFVTVLLTMIDFVIGSYTPYPAIQVFSDFALSVLAFDFILQMLIYVPVLVLTYGWEVDRRHSCCFCVTTEARTAQNLPKWSNGYIMCCSYGRIAESEDEDKEEEQETIYANLINNSPDKAELDDEVEEKANWQSLEDENQFSTGKRLAYKYLAPAVLNPIARIVIAALTVLVLITSALIVWKKLYVGFHPAFICGKRSNTYRFSEYEWKYFREFTDILKIDVLIDISATGKSFKQVNEEIVKIIEDIEKHDSYLWGPAINNVPFRKAQLTNITVWEDLLRHPNNLTKGIDYVRSTTKGYLKPVIYRERAGEIRVGSWNEFNIRNIPTIQRGAEMATRLADVQHIYESSGKARIYISDDFNLLRVFDQMTNLPSQFVEFVMITVASTVVTSIIMIPHPICIFWMAISSLCIILQTLAGMALWEVSLDPISLIYLLMSIGATADYICHCIYLFTIIEPVLTRSSREKIPWSQIRYEKAKILFAELTAETVPAAIGTTLSIVVLSTTDNYILYSFFRVFFVAVVVGLTFMIIVLPGIMCQFGPVATICCQNDQVEDDDFSIYEPDISKKCDKTFTEGPLKVVTAEKAIEIARLQQLRLYLLDTYVMTKTAYRGDDINFQKKHNVLRSTVSLRK